MHTLAVTGGWETVLDGPARGDLERSVLPEYLPAHRWFGGKARRIASVHLDDWGTLPAGPSPTFLALFAVQYADGASDRYVLPLGVAAGADAVAGHKPRPPWALAELTGPS